MERKKLFTNTLVPIIFIENQKILNDRKKILDWLNEMEGESISKEFWPQWLLDLSKKYDYKESNLGNLLMRVDIVPISLALGQAAIESGWGTSRYAREGNAIFGQYTFDKNQGLKPNRREKDKDFFGRTVAECFVNGESLSTFMVRSGYAFDFVRYSKKKYAEDEAYAKANKLGLWTMKFEYPWEWRKKIREQNK